MVGGVGDPGGMDSTMILAMLATLVTGVALGAILGWLAARDRSTGELARVTAERDAAHDRLADAGAERTQLTSRLEQLSGHAVVRQRLDELHLHLRQLEQSQASWQSQLRQQVDDVRHTGDVLRRETSALSTALRKPQVRGRWGELHLQRAVELAGMVEHCDFSQQVTSQHSDRQIRPDLVVHLAGGKQVVVDAKVPLDAFLDATSTDDDAIAAEHLVRHARQVRHHIDTLAGKAYWRELPETPEFVVMFVPGESFLSHALDTDSTLLEYAAAKQVIVATPTTLIALLRTVGYAWTQEAATGNARQIHALGRELYERLATSLEHLDKLGRSLTSSVRSYNQTLGSLESRVLVSARRLRELKVSDADLPEPQRIEEAARPSTSAELLVTDQVPNLKSDIQRGTTELSHPPSGRAVGE
ncbi:MAG: DNA recombination protein RmuC [Propionibacteriales bacterium]|nr:DNA recombination protein RmuC [Propionibacteriales bacterium]